MNTFTKLYVAPVSEIVDGYSKEIMIEIGSGETSPEESDSNKSFFEEEDFSLGQQPNLWDD